MESNQYDLIIVGTGPAGLTAGTYAARYNLKTLILGEEHGGSIADAHKVCNFPTYKEIKGSELAEKIKDQAEEYGAEIKMGRVEDIETNDELTIKTGFGDEYQGKTLLLATGTQRKHLNLDREEEFLGKGVSYCATCDGRFFDDQVVGIIGGSNAAATAALFLADVAKKVYLIFVEENLIAVEAWQDQVRKTDNIELVKANSVTKLLGDEELEGVELEKKFNRQKELELKGLFVEIGSLPNMELSEDLGLDLTKEGYVKVDEVQKTNHDLIWAAGDITDNSNDFRQAVTASAEGAVAANSIYKYIKNIN